MKLKILSILLGVSLLFNIAGLVFFIQLLRVNDSYKHMKRERNTMAVNLTAKRASEMMDKSLDSGQVVRCTFCSVLDGQQDTYALAPPVAPGRMDNTLVVYLHGMGSTYMEPFICPTGTTIAQRLASSFPNLCILSCSYRGDASWGTDAALSDITQNIRSVMQQFPIKNIVLMGTSMGGCMVLTYATQAPEDIKQKLSGIVSVEGASDLQKLYDQTANEQVRIAINAAMGGAPQQAPVRYANYSFAPQSGKLPAAVRVAVISATMDRIVPPSLQADIVESLKKHCNPVKLIEYAGSHGVPPATYYTQGLTFALGKG
jgi:dienelactone hydrolase